MSAEPFCYGKVVVVVVVVVVVDHCVFALVVVVVVVGDVCAFLFFVFLTSGCDGKWVWIVERNACRVVSLVVSFVGSFVRSRERV
jgi:hypothetical protein